MKKFESGLSPKKTVTASPAPSSRKPARKSVAEKEKEVGVSGHVNTAEKKSPAKRGRPRKVTSAATKAVPAKQSTIVSSEAEETKAPEAATLATAHVKRGRGRPKKIVASSEVAPQDIVKDDTAIVKRGRGRPRKAVPSSEASEKVDTAVLPLKKGEPELEKKKRGRPRKTTLSSGVTADDNAAGSAGPLLPLNETSAESPAPRKRGRPKKQPASPDKNTPSLTTSVTSNPIAPEQPAESTSRKAGGNKLLAIPDAESEALAISAESVSTVENDVADERPVFSSLGLSQPIMRAIEELGYTHPTPIQAQAIPVVLQGHDVLGVAQTGTGKTASFTLPMMERLSGSRARARMPRSLILEPTRELALQVAENFALYGKHLRLNHALLIGGESMADQRAVLNQGVDVLIATPGRLIDLFERGGLLMNQTRLLVIDEADRMLDMGFIPDIERIVSLLPKDRQTLFFSATMAPEIRKLADNFLNAPEEITVARASSVATTIDEALIVVDEHDKRRTLRRLLRDDAVQNAIVFCNRKRDVDILQKSLHKHRFAAGHLHGDLPQSLRSKTLERFRNGELKILVCSDVAARGIDISGLSHVFNFDLPFHAEDYVHRIGRTGRAGNKGHAYSLATPFQKPLLDAIETLIGKAIPQPSLDGIETLPWADPDTEALRRDRKREGKKHDRRHSQGSGGQPAVSHKPEPAHAPRSVTPVADFEHSGNPTGFGSGTPAFMLLPRRCPSASDTAERTGPVKHHDES